MRIAPTFSRALRLAVLVAAIVVPARADVGHEFLPPEHWSYAALARFESLGLCTLPSERLFNRDEIIAYTETIAARATERGVALSERDRFNLARLQQEFSSEEARANPKSRYDRPLFSTTDGPFRVEGDLDVAFVPDKAPANEDWEYFGVAHPILRMQLGSSLTYEVRYRAVMGPETEGREDGQRPNSRERSWRGLTSLFERSYLVYQWKQARLYFGRDYADWGPAEDNNVILSKEAGSLDKLGGHLQFRNFRFSAMHAILTSPGERYLTGHRLEGTFGRFTAGVSETVVHLDRFLDPVYMLPFSSFYANQYNERSDDNVLWGVDVKYRAFDRATVDASLLIDDFQYERGDSTPDVFAFNVGVRVDTGGRVPLSFKLRYRYADIYTYTHRDSLKVHVGGDGDPNAGDPILGIVEGPDTDFLTAGIDAHPVPRLTATLLFGLLRRGEGNDFREFVPGDPWAPDFPSGVVERTTSFGVGAAWEFGGNSRASAEVARSHVENEGHISGADDWRTSARVTLLWNL